MCASRALWVPVVCAATVVLLVVYALFPYRGGSPLETRASLLGGQTSEGVVSNARSVVLGGINATESAAVALKRVCELMAASGAGVAPDVRHVMRWVCARVGGVVPQQLNSAGCRKTVTYNPIGRLGNLLNLYAILFSFRKMYGANSYIDSAMWDTLHGYFPHITLPSTSELPETSWKGIAYQEAEEYLACKPDDSTEPQHFRIENYPDRNGIDVFHPFYSELREEFQFSDILQRQAQQFLHYASANRSSTTFIGFHIRRTDYEGYISSRYSSGLPGEYYFAQALDYYRDRYPDALFIVCSDDMAYVEKALQKPQQRQIQEKNDIVTAGNRNIDDPGRDMALLAACNHSIITVGTYGFWGAYLAGGTVLTPEKQTHMSMGDRHAPLLEIQLAGAKNWIAL